MSTFPVKSEEAARYVREAVEREDFPGAVFLTGAVDEGTILCEAYGCAQWLPFRRPMKKDTQFDIASLSKLTGVWPGVMRLLGDGKLTLESTLGDLLPGRPVHPAIRNVTVFHLLTHTAGLHPFMNTHGETREERINSLLELPPIKPAGVEAIYSDLSFIFLGEILAAKTGMPLEESAAVIWRELGMEHTFYNPPRYLDFAATELRAGRTLPQVGEVHDERSTQLGGVAGHAGVFSTAEDLSRFCRAICIPDKCTVLKSEWVRRSYTNQTEALGGDRGLGWVVYNPQVVGHTGFTGTSIWMHTETGEYAVLLTNRVHPTRDNENLYPVRVAARHALWPDLTF